MVIDKNKVTLRFVVEPRAGMRRIWLTSKGRGRLQGLILGVSLSAAIVATRSLSGFETGESPVSNQEAGSSRERGTGVQTSVLAPELRITKPSAAGAPRPSPVHDWPRRPLHLPAAYHQAGEAVMGRVLGVIVGEVELEMYGGCQICHSPGALCLADKIDFSLSGKNSALLHTAGWGAAKLFGRAGRFGDPEGLDPDYLSVDAQARELGLSLEEIKRETLRILNQPGNRRAVEAIAGRLVSAGRVSRDEVERTCAQSQSEQSTTKKGDF